MSLSLGGRKGGLGRIKKTTLIAGSGPTIQTLATKLSGKVYSAPEVVVFEDPRKKKKKDDQPEKPVENRSKPVDRKKAQLEAELSMKQAR